MINATTARHMVAQYEENLFNAVMEELDAAITEAAANGLTSIKFDLSTHGYNSYVTHRIIMAIRANGFDYDMPTIASNQKAITVIWKD